MYGLFIIIRPEPLIVRIISFFTIILTPELVLEVRPLIDVLEKK